MATTSTIPLPIDGLPLPRRRPRKPPLTELGLDLLVVSPGERAVALALPFACAGGFVVFGWLGWWILALGCAVAQSFFTYASVSHDLVHGTLALPRRSNEWLLCAIELLSFRSGHAFRATHLQHHARFPDDDDLEGRAAGLPWWRALLDGVAAQPRLWLWALRHSHDPARRWILGEGLAAGALALTCLAVWPWAPVATVYAVVIIAGSWVYPFATSWMPHNPRGLDALSQTRLFRGWMIRLLSLEHLYHLEHHLYPQVPHQRWPELARRLDSYFAGCGVPAIVLWR